MLQLLAQEFINPSDAGSVRDEIIEPRQSDLNWILVAGLLQPFVTQLLTKTGASSSVKRIVNGILSALVGAANAIYEDQQNGGPFDWKRAMLVSLGVWLASAQAYVHLWKGTGPMDRAEAVSGVIGRPVAGGGDGVPVPVPPGVNPSAPPATDFEWEIKAVPVKDRPPS